jgi:hypothetical protein
MVINRIRHIVEPLRLPGPSYIVCRKKKRNSVPPISWLLPGGVGVLRKKKKIFSYNKSTSDCSHPVFYRCTDPRRHLWHNLFHINLLISRFLPKFSCLFIFFIFYFFCAFLIILCVQVGSVRLLTGQEMAHPVYGISRQTGAAQQGTIANLNFYPRCFDLNKWGNNSTYGTIPSMSK